MNESKRQLKFAKLIQEELADIFVKETRNLFGTILITVTRVIVSADLSVAKVYLSLLLTGDKQKTFKEIKDQTKNIRNLLASRIKKNVRIIPELIFYLDESAEYAQRINKLIENLNIPPDQADTNTPEENLN